MAGGSLCYGHTLLEHTNIQERWHFCVGLRKADLRPDNSPQLERKAFSHIASVFTD